jgi:hypothetical protein
MGGPTASGGASSSGAGASGGTPSATGSGGAAGAKGGGRTGAGGSTAFGGSVSNGGRNSGRPGSGGDAATSGGTSGQNRGGVGGEVAVAGAPDGGAIGVAGASNGGVSNGGAASGGAGGATQGSCNVTPVSPNASPQARNLLCYLYRIYKTSVLSGQQETSWSNPENDISFYVTNTGKSPAILGGDYLYPMGTTDRAKAYWNAGGLTMIRYHMGAPPNSDTYENSKGSANIDNVLMNGTSENTSFKSKLDYVAGELQKLEDANVAVIWAPFHEYQPNGWFWWSKGTPAQFKQLWQYMFDYLTTTKGLTNLVWLAPSSGTVSADWYPAKQYYDIAGPDTYDAGQPFASLYSQAQAIVGSTVPIPLHETGKIPQPSQMFPSAAPWLLFNIWAGYETDTSQNTLQSIKDAYSSPYLITRDELPNLK